MKHLKTINELYINTSEVSGVIDDILLEINDIPKFTSLNWSVDDGMVVIVKLSENDDYMEEGVNISGDIKETIKRLLDFMNDSGYEYLMEFGTDNIPPGTPQKEAWNDYIRKFEYKELDDNDLTIWIDEFIRITFTK